MKILKNHTIYGQIDRNSGPAQSKIQHLSDQKFKGQKIKMPNIVLGGKQKGQMTQRANFLQTFYKIWSKKHNLVKNSNQR